MIDWYANKLDIYIWDVGHGLSVTIITPFVFGVSGVAINRRRVIQIDAGVNNEYQFSPITYLVEKCGLRIIDHFFVSHVDKDHIDELPEIYRLVSLGKLRIISFIRNRSFPDDEISKIISEETAAKTTYRNLHSNYIYPLGNHDLLHPFNFAGVQVEYNHLFYTEEVTESNNLSIVASVKFGNTQIVVPGDLEEKGSDLLIKLGWMPPADFSNYRILLAPHHGSYTAKPAGMLNFFKPHIVLASAEKDHEYTDPLYSSPDYVIGHPVRHSNGVEEVRRFSATKGEAIHIETYGHYPTIKRIPYEKQLSAQEIRSALSDLLSGMNRANVPTVNPLLRTFTT